MRLCVRMRLCVYARVGAEYYVLNVCVQFVVIACVCMYVHVYVNICVFSFMFVCACLYANVCGWLCVRVCTVCVRVFAYVCVSLRIFAYVRT